MARIPKISGFGKPNSQAAGRDHDAETDIDHRHGGDVGREIVLDVVGDADETQLGIAAGDERRHVSAKFHLAGQENNSVTRNRSTWATAGVTKATTGVTMLMRDGSTATVLPADGSSMLLQLAQRRQRAVEHVELLLDAGADFRRAADPLGERRGDQGRHQPRRRPSAGRPSTTAVSQGDTPWRAPSLTSGANVMATTTAARTGSSSGPQK